MRALWHTLIALLTLGPIAWLISIYPDLPDRIPVHWNIRGEADRWADKGVGSVFQVAAVSVLAQLLMGVLAHDADAARSRTGSPTLRHSLSTMIHMLQPMRLASAGLFGIIILGLRPGGAAPSWFGPAMTSCVVILILAGLVGAYRSWKAQMEHEATVSEKAPELQPENYKLGVIYYNPADDNFLVHKRFGIGFTINAAHPRAKLYLVLILGLILTPAGLALFG